MGDVDGSANNEGDGVDSGDRDGEGDGEGVGLAVDAGVDDMAMRTRRVCRLGRH